jgi:hypothetical protein
LHHCLLLYRPQPPLPPLVLPLLVLLQMVLRCQWCRQQVVWLAQTILEHRLGGAARGAPAEQHRRYLLQRPARLELQPAPAGSRNACKSQSLQ